MHLQRRSTRRLIAGTLAGALVVGVSPLVGVPSAAAAALPPVADPVAAGAFCDAAPTSNPFTDLGGESDTTRKTILCLVATELTTGTSSSTYTPGGAVTRRQMALFVKRLADLLYELQTGTAPLAPLPAYDGQPDFSDVAAGDTGATAIGQLSQAEIVGGFPDGTFRPNEQVTRRQMAAFVNRLQAFVAGQAYTSDQDYFTDDDGDSGEANFNALAEAGIFQGDGQGHVFPAANMTRRQMASIVLRDAQVFFADGLVDSPFKPQNASFRMAPPEMVTREVAVEPSTSDDRTYRILDLVADTTYTIQLFPAANVQGTTTITFTEDGTTNTADEGSVAAVITKVNGTTIVGPSDRSTAQPVNGEMTFTVDGSAFESIVPIVYEDANTNSHLDLGDDNAPVAAEPFGIGGSLRYLPAQAAIGSSGITVTAVTDERDAFVSGGRTYYYDTSDAYRYQGVPITRAQFDSMLSAGDVGTANYNPDRAGASIFDITTDDVDAPAAPSVAVINGDAGATINDVRVTYTRPATNSPGVAYSLQRAVVDKGADTTCGTGDDTVGAFASISATQAAGTGEGVFVFSDNNVADGCYTYRVRATSPVSGTTAESAAPAGTAVPGAPDTTAPTSTYAKRTVDVNATAFDTGDVIKVVFDEPMAVPPTGATLRLVDGDLTYVDVINGTNATFTFNTAGETVGGISRGVGTVLTITLTADPSGVLPGLVPGLQAPADVQDRSGIMDLSSNAWDLSGSSDVTID